MNKKGRLNRLPFLFGQGLWLYLDKLKILCQLNNKVILKDCGICLEQKCGSDLVITSCSVFFHCT